MWLALCRRTRQIVAFTLGDRSEETAARLRQELPRDYRCRATRSDQWQPYAKRSAKHTHRLCQKKEGQTRFYLTDRSPRFL